MVRSDVEIFRFRVMGYDRAGRLLRLEHELLGEGDADPLRTEEREELLLVVEVRAGRIAERVAAAAIALREEPADVRRVVAGDPELDTNRTVPIFRQRLGRFDREAAQVEIAAVFSRGKKFGGLVGGGLADRHDLEGHDVESLLVDRAIEIRKAETTSVRLARELEALPRLEQIGAQTLQRTDRPLVDRVDVDPLRLVDDQRLAVRLAGEV